MHYIVLLSLAMAGHMYTFVSGGVPRGYVCSMLLDSIRGIRIATQRWEVFLNAAMGPYGFKHLLMIPKIF
jgi:hypothetical protein